MKIKYAIAALLMLMSHEVMAQGNTTGLIVASCGNQTFKAGNPGPFTVDLTGKICVNLGSGVGTVTSVSVTTANGVSGVVANPTTTPAITLTLGAITPTTVNGNTLTTGTGTLTLGSVTLNAGAGGTLGSNAFTSTAYLPLAGGTLTGGVSTNSQITSILATGTAPLVIASTTLVPNLYVQRAVLADSTTTNANLTGPITSVGNATSIASQTGTGTKFVVDTSPTLVTPNIGVAAGTSLALNGATIGSNALAVTGTFNNANFYFQASTSSSFIGTSAGNLTSTGNANTAFGFQSGLSLTVPASSAQPQANTFVGYQAGKSVTSGRETTLMGYQAGAFLTGNGAGVEDGINTAYGSLALSSEILGTGNVAIGQKAGLSISSGTDNVFLGTHSGANFSSGANNILIGRSVADTAAAGNVTGDDNTYIGTSVARGVGAKSQNTVVGSNAGRGLTTGATSALFGYQAGNDITTGASNTFIGSNTGRGVTTGGNNTVIGANVTGLSASLVGTIVLAIGDGSIKADYAKTTAGAWTYVGAITASGDLNSGGSVRASAGGGIYWAGRAQMASNVDSNITVYNNAGNAFNLFQFGGTTSSFPALKRSTTSLQVRLADDSADAGLSMSTLTASGISQITNATDASASSGSGALQVAGGASIAKRFWIPAITASSGLQTAVLCQSSGGEMIADSVACLASSARFKDIRGPLSSDIVSKFMKLPIKVWAYKAEGIFKKGNWTRDRIGPIAEDVEKLDPRLVEYDNDGYVRAYSTEQLLAYTIKVVQEQQVQIDGLRARRR